MAVLVVQALAVRELVVPVELVRVMARLQAVSRAGRWTCSRQRQWLAARLQWVCGRKWQWSRWIGGGFTGSGGMRDRDMPGGGIGMACGNGNWQVGTADIRKVAGLKRTGIGRLHKATAGSQVHRCGAPGNGGAGAPGYGGSAGDASGSQGNNSGQGMSGGNGNHIRQGREVFPRERLKWANHPRQARRLRRGKPKRKGRGERRGDRAARPSRPIFSPAESPRAMRRRMPAINDRQRHPSDDDRGHVAAPLHPGEWHEKPEPPPEPPVEPKERTKRRQKTQRSNPRSGLGPARCRSAARCRLRGRSSSNAKPIGSCSCPTRDGEAVPWSSWRRGPIRRSTIWSRRFGIA